MADINQGVSEDISDEELQSAAGGALFEYSNTTNNTTINNTTYNTSGNGNTIKNVNGDMNAGQNINS